MFAVCRNRDSQNPSTFLLTTTTIHKPDLRFSNTTGILQKKKKKKKTMWFIGVEVQQETSARPPKKNP